MSTEEMSLFIQVLQFGFATGSRDRFDCLRVFVRAYPDQHDAAVAAAAAFERGCCYCLEQAEQAKQMSDQQFADWVFAPRTQAGAYIIR